MQRILNIKYFINCFSIYILIDSISLIYQKNLGKKIY